MFWKNLYTETVLVQVYNYTDKQAPSVCRLVFSRDGYPVAQWW